MNLENALKINELENNLYFLTGYLEDYESTNVEKRSSISSLIAVDARLLSKLLMEKIIHLQNSY
ncbi:hypothetical protein GCM10028805_46060 [Spirosoma harenae]